MVNGMKLLVSGVSQARNRAIQCLHVRLKERIYTERMAIVTGRYRIYDILFTKRANSVNTKE